MTRTPPERSKHAPVRRTQPAGDELTRTKAALLDEAASHDAQFQKWVSDRPLGVVAAALMTGFTLGISPAARRAALHAARLVLRVTFR
ncbi:MAG: hypothetical protein GC162_04265 [Planctomycetes bacterium]|nr:hypothetical protein [Planctomycetota bacterium]